MRKIFKLNFFSDTLEKVCQIYMLYIYLPFFIP